MESKATGKIGETIANEGVGPYLRRERTQKGLSISQVSRVTKISEKNLNHLEDEKYESLPADTFVRGFIRSYARCIGVDSEAVVKRYNSYAEPITVCSELALNLKSPYEDIDETVKLIATGNTGECARPARATTLSKGTLAPGGGGTGESRAHTKSDWSGRSKTCPGATVSSNTVTRRSTTQTRNVTETSASTKNRVFLPPVWPEQEPKRGPLTLAVIILVIVATLTMSYLLRKPRTHTGGYTAIPELFQTVG